MPVQAKEKVGFNASVSGNIGMSLTYLEKRLADVDQLNQLEEEKINQSHNTFKLDYSLHSSYFNFLLAYKKKATDISATLGLGRHGRKNFGVKVKGKISDWSVLSSMNWSEDWGKSGNVQQGSQMIRVKNKVHTFTFGYKQFYNLHWQSPLFTSSSDLADNFGWGRIVGKNIKGFEYSYAFPRVKLGVILGVDQNIGALALNFNKDKFDWDDDGKVDKLTVDTRIYGFKLDYAQKPWNLKAEYVFSDAVGNNNIQKDNKDSANFGRGYLEKVRYFALGVGYVYQQWLFTGNYSHLSHAASAGMDLNGVFRHSEDTHLSHSIVDVGVSYRIDKNWGISSLIGIRRHLSGERYYALSGMATSENLYFTPDDSKTPEQLILDGQRVSQREIVHFEIGTKITVGVLKIGSSFIEEFITAGGVYDAASESPTIGRRRRFLIQLDHPF